MIVRRFLTPPISGSLPSGYVALDYVQGTSGYITTDLTVNNSDSIFIDFQFTSKSYGIYGSYNDYGNPFGSTTPPCVLYFTHNGSGTNVPKGVFSEKTTSSSSATYLRFRPIVSSWDVTLTTSRYSVMICDTFVANDGALITTYTSNPLSFLYYKRLVYNRLEDMEVPTQKAMPAKLYRFSLFKCDGTITHDLLPCTNPNGEEGLYDVVCDKFYGFTPV